MKKSNCSRREFVAIGAAAAAAGLVGGGACGAAEPPRQGKSRVVLVRRREVLGADGSTDPAVLAAMLDEAATALLGAETAAAAWRELVRPGDVVGIKSNAWRNLPTPAALEKALQERVVAAGVKPAEVSVDDRGVRENPVFRRATAFINVRPMRTHHWSGLGTCLKNYIMFVESPPDYHADGCARLGEIWTQPELKGKTRLNLLVLLTPQFHGAGPHSFSPAYIWRYCGLLLGIDPVAVDATGARIIAAYRRQHFGEDRPMVPTPHHIEVADRKYQVGTSDPARIDLVRLGWDEGALI
jgi:hypothetical protein